MCKEISQNYATKIAEKYFIPSPWDEDETVSQDISYEESQIEDLKTIARGVAVGFAWKMSGLLDKNNPEGSN